jgi:hypothetical protein
MRHIEGKATGKRNFLRKAPAAKEATTRQPTAEVDEGVSEANLRASVQQMRAFFPAAEEDLAAAPAAASTTDEEMRGTHALGKLARVRPTKPMLDVPFDLPKDTDIQRQSVLALIVLVLESISLNAVSAPAILYYFSLEPEDFLSRDTLILFGGTLFYLFTALLPYVFTILLAIDIINNLCREHAYYRLLQYGVLLDFEDVAMWGIRMRFLLLLTHFLLVTYSVGNEFVQGTKSSLDGFAELAATALLSLLLAVKMYEVSRFESTLLGLNDMATKHGVLATAEFIGKLQLLREIDAIPVVLYVTACHRLRTREARMCCFHRRSTLRARDEHRRAIGGTPMVEWAFFYDACRHSSAEAMAANYRALGGGKWSTAILRKRLDNPKHPVGRWHVHGPWWNLYRVNALTDWSGRVFAAEEGFYYNLGLLLLVLVLLGGVIWHLIEVRLIRQSGVDIDSSVRGVFS